MKYLTVYCLFFALMSLDILVSGKCRKKGQKGKDAVEKPKKMQGNCQNNATSQELLQDNPVNQDPKENQTSENDESMPLDTSRQTDEINEADKTQQTNVTETIDVSQPSESNYPYEFDAKKENTPADKSSRTDKIDDIDRAKETNDTDPTALGLPSELDFPRDTNSPGQPDQASKEAELGYNGYLYDVFKKRLNQVFQELYNNVKTSSGSAPPPLAEIEIDKPKKRSAVSNCLYEEFKRRLDKFNNEFMEPGKAIKRTSGEFDGNRVGLGGKRSTELENLYEEYKRRLDKLGNELWFDGEKVFDRSGRGAPGMLPFTAIKLESKPKRSDADKATEQDFYEEYKKKLDQLTRELYEKSNERISRTYTQLTEHELNSPTLQRLVEAVQLDDGKSAKGDSRDGSGSFQGSTYLLKIDKAIDDLNKQQDKRSLDATDLGSTIFGADSLNFMTGATTGVGATAAASYPAVLTKTVDANLGLLGNTAPKNMLATVASKMNMTTLELAKKLASMSNPLEYVAQKDPQLGEEIQKLIGVTVNNKLNQSPSAVKKSPSPINEVSIVSGLPLLGPDSSGVPTPLLMQDALFGAIPALAPAAAPAAVPAAAPTPPPTAASTQTQEPPRAKPAAKPQPPQTTAGLRSSEAEAARIAGVLDRVLCKLEHMQESKATTPHDEHADENCEPDGMPCDVVGSWNSYEMGLRFDISLSRAADRRLGMAEKNNKLLTIEAGERVPPHAHHIIDTGWKFMGSALNQQGGPFYIYTQNRELNTLTTFVGYCRVCGGIDTIFGSWALMGPSKDCQDVSTALENRRDIFRRYNMENKRNKHFKDMLFENSKYSKPDCDGNKNG